MARGDIVLVDIPAPPGGQGHEQAGERPALVIHSDGSSGQLPVLMIIPFTTNLNALRYPHTIRVEPSPRNGLAQASILLVFQLRAIDKRRLGRRLGYLERELLEHVETEIAHLLSLEPSSSTA